MTYQIRNEEDWLTGVFTNREDAEKAYSELLSCGYRPQDITVLMSEELRNKHFLGTQEVSKTNQALEGAGIGGIAGGAIASLAAAIAAVGATITIPGLGIAIAGPLAAAFMGAGVGSVAGSITGALINLGIHNDHAEHYEEILKAGKIVVRVKPQSVEDRELIKAKWQSCC